MKNNTQHVKRGFIWSISERFGTQTIQFITNIFIARLILPEDYGLIGMMALFLGIGQIVVDGGLSLALIQKKNITTLDISTMFFTNLIMGGILYFIFFFSAPYIADFYNQPVLVNISRIICLSFILNSFGLVQKTLFTKKILFKQLTVASLVSVTVSGGAGIFLALSGFRVWSLVYMYLINSFLLNLIYWLLSDWKPKLEFSVSSFKNLYSFGVNILSAGLLNTIFQNLYFAVIGKFFPPVQLGYYTQATKIQSLPVQNFTTSIQRVAFSHFSDIQDDDDKFVESFRKIIRVTMFIVFPLMFFIILDSPHFVPFLLTEKWSKIVPFLQLLSIVGMLYPLHALNLSVINAKGKSKLFLILEIIKKILIIINIVLTIKISILAMIYGQICITIISFFINAYFPSKLLKYKIRKQILDILPSFLFASISFLIIYAVSEFINSSQFIMVSLQIFGFGILYLAFAFYFRKEELNNIKQVFVNI